MKKMTFNEMAAYSDVVIDASRLMIAVLDRDAKVVQVNSVFENVTGYSLSEFKGLYWSNKIFFAKDKKAVKRILQGLPLEEAPAVQITKILTRDGRERFVEWSYRMIRQTDPDDRNILIVGQDISERFRNERKLLRERIKLIERNKELTCLYGMAKIAVNSDISLPELLQSIVTILPPAFQFPEIASARIQMKEDSYATAGFKESDHKLCEKIIIQRKELGSIEVFYPAKRVRKGKGRIHFLIEEHRLLRTIARQVTLMIEKKLADDKRLELEGQLRHADRLAKIGQLTAGVAHELNEPLGNILGFAQLAVKTPDLPFQVCRDLENIVQSSLHAREIIKKLMLFSRQMPHRKVRVNLNTLIADGLAFIEPRFANNQIRFIKDLDPDLPEITADPSQLTQVLVNLVINAVQAMPAGGALTIETIAEDEAAVLCVKDTGIGMEKEIVEQIFLPFFTTKEVDQGTGLGLSVVHGIVTAHGGKIMVDSEKGKGSRFTIQFPCDPGKGAEDGE
ncbi:MAG: PAS domain S-box protein [Desulfobacteraceae bacterium]|nr:MAG: PAS domain S-box protein [Desulfobacteraceae bacterium]